MQTIPGIVINVVLFAIIFPLMMRVVGGKWIGWLQTVVTVVLYVAIGLLLEHSHAIDWLLDLVGARLS